MDSPGANTFRKEERLCGKTGVSALIAGGRWGMTAHIKYCWKASGTEGVNRIMVSVPKKYFKRAVKRNLLKRRIREAYRTQKSLLNRTGTDVLFQYNSANPVPYDTVREEVAAILKKISG